MLGIKNLAEDSSGFQAITREPEFRDRQDVMRILTFGDYVTAIVAKRQCSVGVYNQITGITTEGSNWQVPFVKCDSRRCEENEEDAYKYCVYPILALAPSNVGDIGGNITAYEFKEYVETRYPQLTDPELTHFNGYDFIQVFPSNAAINEYVKHPDYGNAGREQIGLAIIFDGNDEMDFRYSLRVNSTNFNAPENEGRPATLTTPSTKRTFSRYAREDDACTPEGGTPEQGPMENSCTGQYIYNGFLTTQRLVHDFVMHKTNSTEFVSEHGVGYVPFPTQRYTEEGFYGILAEYMPILMTLGLLYPVSAMISYIVQEKELRQKELMKMMSVADLEIGWSWFLSFFSVHFFTATFVALITGSLFANSDTGLLFFFWQLCFLAFVIFSMFLATLFSKTTRAVLVGLLGVFVGFILPLLVDVETGSSGLISLVSLHPITAMSYGLQEIGRLEDAGVGLTSDTVDTTDAPSGYTFNGTFGGLISSSIFWGFLTWYFNRVIPPAYGQAMPIWFPFTRSYWCPGSVQPDQSDSNGNGFEDDTVPLEPVPELLKQQSGKTNIEIKHLRKAFNEKVAVDDLNLDMYSGQITALLGHNGGKLRLVEYIITVLF